MDYQTQDYLYVSGILNKLGFTNSSFLITGATGLIGSFIMNTLHFANEKYNFNNKIIAVVRNKEKAELLFPWINKYNTDANLYVVENIANSTLDINSDYIIHTAGNTNSNYMISNPVETSLEIIEGTKAVLELGRKQNVKGIAILSSMEVYGQILDKTVVDESFPFGFIDPFNVRSCYPMAKRMVENLVCSYFSEYGIPAIVLRLAQTFGYPVDPFEKRLFGLMIKSAKEKHDIVLSTTGNKINNFCYLSDAVSAIFYVLKYGEYGTPYNVCNTASSMSIIDNARLITDDIMQKQITVKFNISHQSAKKFAPDSKFILDSSKLKLLGWKPTVNIYEAYWRNIFY